MHVQHLYGLKLLLKTETSREKYLFHLPLYCSDIGYMITKFQVLYDQSKDSLRYIYTYIYIIKALSQPCWGQLPEFYFYMYRYLFILLLVSTKQFKFERQNPLLGIIRSQQSALPEPNIW